MKWSVFIGLCAFLLLVVACAERDKTKILAQYKFEENTNILPANAQPKLESWIKEGVECYGVIMVCDLSGNPLRMKEAHVKVVSIRPKKIKMQALEDVVINRTIECKKVSFKKGESWEEEYGEVFRTREEAIKYINERYPGLRVNH